MNAKITLKETPTAQLLALANTEVTITDKRGRKITIKKPGLLAQYRIVEVMGDSASNNTYADMIQPLIYVTAIDGDEIYQPKNKLQLEALIQQLDDDGLEAVVSGIIDNFGKKNAEVDKAAIKK